WWTRRLVLLTDVLVNDALVSDALRTVALRRRARASRLRTRELSVSLAVFFAGLVVTSGENANERADRVRRKKETTRRRRRRFIFQYRARYLKIDTPISCHGTVRRLLRASLKTNIRELFTSLQTMIYPSTGLSTP